MRKGHRAALVAGLALLVLALPTAPVRAVAQAKYLGGVTWSAGIYTTDEECDRRPTNGVDSAPCVRQLSVKFRLLAPVSSTAVAWVEVEGVQSGGDQKWTTYFDAGPPAEVHNISGSVGNASLNQYFNEAGDSVTNCGTVESVNCKAYPFRGGVVPTPTTPGVKLFTFTGNNGGGSPGKFVTAAYPKLRLVMRTGMADSPYEATPWIDGITHYTDPGILPDPPTPGLDGAEAVTPQEPFDPSTGDAEADAECGRWWNIPCHLGRLFIPSGGPVDALQEAYEGSLIDTLMVPLDAVAEAFTSIQDHTSGRFSLYDAPFTGCGGEPQDPDTTACTVSGYSRCQGPQVSIPLGLEDENIEFRPLDGCDPSSPMGMVRGPVRTVALAMMYLGMGLLLFRIIGGAFGVSIGGRETGGGQ